MKKNILCAVMFFLILFSAISISHGSVPLKKRNMGFLVVKTWDTDWNKLGNVPFTLDDEEYETNNKGRKKIPVTPNETHTIEFGEVEGYTINTPKSGMQIFTVGAGKKKIIMAIYEKIALVTPTPAQTPTPKPTVTAVPTPKPTATITPKTTATPAVTPTPVTKPTTTATVTPTPKTVTIPWQMFHYNAQHSGQSHVNGPQTNTLKWKYTQSDITEGTVPNSISIDSNGTLYVTAANKLLAVDSDGKLLWSQEVGGIGATAISSDESTIYAVGKDNLYAFTSAGEQIWSFTDPTDNIYGEPNVGPDGTIYIGSWDSYVYAVNSDGSLKWKYQTDGSIAPLASPTLSNDGNTIYVGSGDRNKDEGGTLYALNADKGTLNWKKENLDGGRVSGAVVDTDGTIYATGSGRLHAFDKNGNQLWESDKDTASSLTPSLSSDGTLYVGTSGGIVYAINASNGKTKWSYQTGQNPSYTGDPKDPQYGVLATIVIGADGIIYVGAIDGVMHALNTDGSVLWKYTTGDNINENCPAIGPDGSLYFSSADKYIYAIKDK